MKVKKFGTKGSKVRVEMFDSFGEFVDYAKHNPSPDSSNKDADKWAGSASLQDAADMARKGYGEIRPQVDSLMAVLQERIAERFGERFVTEYSVTGGTVDMGKFVTGDPECMLDWKAEPSASMGRVVRVCMAGTASANIPAEHIIRRGTAVVALLDTLHKLGVGLELWWDSTISGDTTEDGINRFSTAVKLHDSSEPLDIDNLMWAVAHPSMLRRLTFSVQEQSETKKEQHAIAGWGYGTPDDMGLPEDPDGSFDVTVERLQRGYGEGIVEDPVKWVISTVEGLGFTE